MTFECDTPAQARERRIVSSTALPDGLAPGEIDAFVSRAVAEGRELYRLDAGALADLAADLVVTQDLCAVCAVDVDTVGAALDHLGCTADVLTVDPRTLDDVLASIETIGARVGHADEAAALVGRLRTRVDRLAADVADRPRPRILMLEWTDPPYAPGHWIPEQVLLAGADPALGTPGERSRRITWEQAVATRPDVVISAPCGYDAEQAAALSEGVVERFPGVPVWAVDANAMFARPGPRLVDGAETLARIAHPDLGVLEPGAAVRLA